LASLRIMRRDGVHAQLFDRGRWLMQRLQEEAARHGVPIRVMGPGPMFHVGYTAHPEVHDYRDTLHYDGPRYAAFVRAMQERGVRLIGRGLWYISAAHAQTDLEYAACAAAEAWRNQ
jgi:glutamate-1-semialdehyde 2,1-aminomutase